MTFPDVSIRQFLLREVRTFVERMRGTAGVRRVALVGSLTTPKEYPKDADLLVWVDNGADLSTLAHTSRQLKGRAQSRNSGADIFVVNPDGVYQGRICNYRDCRPGIRTSCRALHCGRRAYLCDDLHVITLPASVIVAPPLELWPQAMLHATVPADIKELVVALQLTESGSDPDKRRSKSS